MKVPVIFGGWLNKKSSKTEIKKQDNFEWKYLDEENSKRLGLEMTIRPDEIIYTEFKNKWAGRLRFHTIPGHILLAEHFSINQSLNMNRKDFQKILFSLLEKLVEIMESDSVPILEVYIASPAITRALTSLGAKVTYQQGERTSLSWTLEEMKNLKLKRTKLLGSN